MTAQLNSTAGPGVGVARRLVFADIAHQYSVTPTRGAPVVVAELASEAGNGARAMELLHREDTVARAISLIGDGEAVRSLPMPAEPLATWAGTRLPAEFTAHLSSALTMPDGAADSPAPALRYSGR